MTVTMDSQMLAPLGQVHDLTGWPLSSSAHSEEGSAHKWRMFTFLRALPRVVLIILNAFLKSQEHHNRTSFISCPHLHIWTNSFPWGDGNYSPFHNHTIYHFPSGYEDE
uniref:Cytochrome c oxidase polypeptide VIa n=1 Tax=Vombatus ursinus TaxID=29139 RepID=A0A4X2KLM7_VOMUR